jgi:hypothetical protein
MSLKKCCDNYVMHSQPKRPQNLDFFDEIHVCSVCGQKLRIRFQRIVTFEHVEYAPISAEVV